MIIVCPDCSTRFELDAARLGPSGRRVRCSRCSHEWLQEPAAEPDPEPPAVRPGEPAALPAPPGFRPAPILAPAVHRARRAERSSGLALGWIALAMFLAVIGGTLFLARADIMAAWPVAARLYQAVGLVEPVPGEGLAILDVRTAASEDGSTPVLVVTGTIRNTADAARDVPRLRAALRDAKGQELRQWVFVPPRRRLEKGDSLGFETRSENPPPAATGLSIVFVADSEK